MTERTSLPGEIPTENLEEVTIDLVRNYLSQTYKLDPKKLDLLVGGACSGIRQAMAEALKHLEARDLVLMGNAVHSMKGALLNMGLNGWAAFAKVVETSAKNGEEMDYPVVLKKLQDGLSALLHE